MQNRRKFLRNTTYGTLGLHIWEQALGKASPTPTQRTYKVLTPIQAKTLEAIAECIWPSSLEDPGAIEAGVVTFIDRSLSEFDHRLKTTYQNGIASTNASPTANLGEIFQPFLPNNKMKYYQPWNKGILNPEKFLPIFPHLNSSNFY